MDVLYGGVCTFTDKYCLKKDVSHVRIRKVALPLDFVENKCACGDDLAIVEVETPFQVTR